MGLRIQTNLPSIAAQRVLDIQQRRIEHSTQALASGNRITRAADDSAGLAISESLRGQIRGVGMARQNAFSASAMLQISEGALNEVSNILIRVRELGIQAASDNIGDQERSYLQQESKALIEESDRIVKSTVFGKRKLLDGSGGELTFQVGPYSGEDNQIKYSLSNNATTSELGVDSVDLSEKGSARDALGSVDTALEKVNSMRAGLGSVQERLNSTVANLDSQFENLSSANSRIRDTDVAKEASDLASANILQSAAVSVLAQANQYPAIAMKLIA